MFSPETIFPPNSPYSQLGPEKRYGSGFVKKSRLKTCFLGRKKLRNGHCCPQLRHLVRLAHKIREVRFITKIQAENVFFGETNPRGLLRQN